MKLEVEEMEKELGNCEEQLKAVEEAIKGYEEKLEQVKERAAESKVILRTGKFSLLTFSCLLLFHPKLSCGVNDTFHNVAKWKRLPGFSQEISLNSPIFNRDGHL